ncbi:hypothetical protein EJB05_54394, partial [Eragrostis curvula]
MFAVVSFCLFVVPDLSLLVVVCYLSALLLLVCGLRFYSSCLDLFRLVSSFCLFPFGSNGLVLSMAFPGLRDISPAVRNWRVRARVARAWEYCGGRDDGVSLHVDLVLVDESKEVAKFRDCVKEGDVYIFSKFIVSNMKPAYRPFDAKYMIKITPWSRIDHVASVADSFPQFVYRLVALPDLGSRVGNQQCFTDVLGIVVSVSKVSHVRINNSLVETARCTIVIKDLSGFEMKIVLWGNRAAEFDADVVFDMGQEHHMVVVFVGLLVKSYRGATCLSGGDACRWYLNDSIPEIEDMYDRLGDEVTKVVWADDDEEFGSSGRQPEDLEHKTVAELHSVDPWECEKASFSCTVTVGRVIQDQQWWFMSCPKCHRAANPYGSEFKCTGECGSVNAIPKYHLCLVCGDSTGAAEFVLFGKVAQQIVGKSAMMLLRRDGLPREIAAVVTQKYTFIVTVNQKSLMQRNLSFQVNSVETLFGRQACVPDMKGFDDERYDDLCSPDSSAGQDRLSSLRARAVHGRLPTLVKRKDKLALAQPDGTDHVDDVKYRCSPSGVPDGAGDVAAEVVGAGSPGVSGVEDAHVAKDAITEKPLSKRRL